MKASSRVRSDVLEEKLPQPNLKVVNGLASCDLKDTVLVE